MNLSNRVASISLKNLGILAKRCNPVNQSCCHHYGAARSHLRSRVQAPSPSPYHQTVRWFRQARDTSGKKGRKSLAPVEELNGRDIGFRDLGKPLAFTLLVSSGSFAGCAIWQYEKLRAFYKKKQQDVHNHFNNLYGKAGGLRHHWKKIVHGSGEVPLMNAVWNALSGGQKVVAGIISINTAVFLLWRVPRLQGFMFKYFLASPAAGSPSLSLLTSTFSHYSLWHLAANMFVLWSFTPSATALFGKEQFLATYLTAGVVSGFASHLYKVVKGRHIPSVGASGAIMAILGAVCTQYPDGRLSIILVDQFIPHSFSASSAMKAIIVFDTLGCVLGWRFFDHAGHLGGMLFGLWYATYGHKLIWGNREPFLQWWHKLRGGPSQT